jgi:uncharacterized membrane protein
VRMISVKIGTFWNWQWDRGFLVDLGLKPSSPRYRVFAHPSNLLNLAASNPTSRMNMIKPSAIRSRIDSIDILRGIVMVIMALDHVRDFFHKVPLDVNGTPNTGPTDLETTTPILFFTRWITHFCAPIFVFLAGTSAWMMSRKKTKAELSSFLLKRGFVLILIECIIITFGITFNPLYNFIIFQVIWAIGISMVVLGLLVRLPFQLILAIGLIIVFGHNLLNYPSINKGMTGFWPDLLYFTRFSTYEIAPGHSLIIVYSFVAWLGVMIMGYCFGKLFTGFTEPAARRKMLLLLGSGLLLLFVVLRLINNYGDPVPWAPHHRGPVFSFLSFININKYPPSLDYICVTIGVGLIMLALLDNAKNAVARFFRVYGRVPMFYYILHFYLIHLLVVVFFFIQGYSLQDIDAGGVLFMFKPPGFGLNLPGVYLIWIFVVLALYPLCKKYDNYKSTHKKWWLSYL